jgi:hypothetical protein
MQKALEKYWPDLAVQFATFLLQLIGLLAKACKSLCLLLQVLVWAVQLAQQQKQRLVKRLQASMVLRQLLEPTPR